MDTIVGGSFSTDGVISLNIDTDKIGFVKFTDGTVIPTVDGVINESYGGDDSDCIIYTHRGNATVDISTSELTGDVVYDGKSEITTNDCLLLTSIVANNLSNISVTGCILLTSLIAKKATSINALGCEALTQQSIYDVLDNSYKLFLGGEISGSLDFGTTTTAIDLATISLKYGIAYDTMITAMTDGGWSIVVIGL